MAVKKAAKGRSSAEDREARKGDNVLLGSVYHNGKNYDSEKASDQKAFAALVEKEGLVPAGTDPKERSKLHKETMQRLADAGAIKGFGTKASSKKKASDEEDTGSSTEVLTEDELRARDE